jgi:hypothetical protein
MPLLPDDPPMPRVNLQARSRLPALDHYDTRARPAAVVFDPLRKTSAAGLLPAMTLGVAPGLRPDPQPVRVLHNGRFSLPAGDYRVDLTFASGQPLAEGDVSLQVGRVGPPVQTWPVAPAAGTLSHTLHLPLDAGFVGFRGSREMEQAIQAITITPVAVVNSGERVPAPPVLGAAQYGASMVLLHDDQVNPEPTGFWVLGRRPTVVSIAPGPEATTPPTVRLRSGVGGNEVTLRTRGWQHVVTLDADTPVDVPLPAPAHGLVELTVVASNGFAPIDRAPASRDRRFLGVWVELVH